MPAEARQDDSPTARAIFLRVLEETEGGDREGLLAGLCGDDPTLRAEVEALFSEQDRLGGFLEAPASSTARARGGSPTEAGFAMTSETLGPYKLLQEIGEGGCGIVYLAEQEQPVRRRVALKVIKLGMDTRSVIARFESERQALALMDHPNIARVYDAGATETGRPYFVMELVRGERITDYCDQHRLSVEDRLQLFMKVVQAIQHAHQKGIIHRDIKPSNILVTLHDGVPVPKIIDFGIAKATEQRLTDKTLFTELQSFMGTPAYMSPEQASMSSLDIDTRSDIYALGVLLYELLVGRTPFAPAELRAAGMDECRRIILETEPERPSQRIEGMPAGERGEVAGRRRSEVPRLVQALRGDLDWIVMRCLEKDRQRRYDGAHALRADVENYLAGDLVSARPPSTLYRVQKLLRRHRIETAAIAVVMLTLVAASVISIGQAVRATRAEDAANGARAEQRVLREEAERGWALALDSARQATLNDYVASMNLAYQALRDGNIGRALQLVEKHVPGEGEADLRGFEWRYLRQLCEGDPHVVLPGQGGSVRALAYAPSGEWLAVGLASGLRVWHLPTRTVVVDLSVSAESLAFSPDGATLFTGNGEGVHVWDTASWTEKAVFGFRADSLALSPDGRTLATHGRGDIRLWDTGTWEPVLHLEETFAPMVFSPDGRRFAANRRPGITVWSLGADTAPLTLEGAGGIFPGDVIFGDGGRTLIAPRNNGLSRGAFVLGIWDALTGKEIGVMPDASRREEGHSGRIEDLDHLPGHSLLASASADHSLVLWDTAERQPLKRLRGHRNEVWAVALSPDGAIVAGGGKDGSLKLWPTGSVERADIIAGSWRPVRFSADGRLLLALDRRERRLAFLDLETRASLRTLSLVVEEDTRQRLVSPLAASRDLSRVVQGLSTGAIHIWNTETGTEEERQLGEDPVFFVTLSPDGRTVVANQNRFFWQLPGEERTLRWLRLDEPGAEPRVIPGDFATFSEDGTTLVTIREGRKVEVWDAAAGMRTRAFEVRPEVDGAMALSPDGRRLAVFADAADFDSAIRLWDTLTGRLLGACRGHKQGVRSVAFSPDGRTLASTSRDSTMKLWNVATRQELLSVRNVGTTLRSLRFSPDGRWLAATESGLSLTSAIHLFAAPRES